MKTPPPEVLAAAQLITRWAAENNIKEFAIAGVQQRAWSTPDQSSWPFPTFQGQPLPRRRVKKPEPAWKSAPPAPF